MKQPTAEQIEAAIDNLSEYRECLKQAGYDAEANSGHIYEAALFALRFLQKAMGEPSKKAIEVFHYEFTDKKEKGVFVQSELYSMAFKAMRDQMLREVENDA